MVQVRRSGHCMPVTLPSHPACPAHAHHPSQVALGFYTRRLLRLVPAYYAAIALTWAAIHTAHAFGDPYFGHLLAFRPLTWAPATDGWTLMR